jgi:hypothetical protein
MMNWKGLGWKRSLPNLRYYHGVCTEGLSKTTKISLSVTGPRYEHRTSRIWSRSVRHWSRLRRLSCHLENNKIFRLLRLAYFFLLSLLCRNHQNNLCLNIVAINVSIVLVYLFYCHRWAEEDLERLSEKCRRSYTCYRQTFTHLKVWLTILTLVVSCAGHATFPFIAD